MRAAIFCLIFLVGCGPRANSKYGSVSDEASGSVEFGWDDSGAKFESRSSRPGGPSMGGGSGDGQAESGKFTATFQTASITGEASSQDVPVARRIIYTATVNVIVENFDGVEKQIQSAVQQHQGYLANVNLDQMQGERRRGRWTARIPVSQYNDFLNSIGNIGVPASQEQDAQDVSEEFVDLTARITNKKKLESRILELLDRPDDKIQHVIEVEQELARVREEIERMEGRLRFLSDRTAMTTVHLSVREERDYQPPQAPTFGNRITSAWSSSLVNATRFFQDATIFLVGNALGLLAWAVVFVVAWFVGRRILRKRKAALAELATPAATA